MNLAELLADLYTSRRYPEHGAVVDGSCFDHTVPGSQPRDEVVQAQHDAFATLSRIGQAIFPTR